MTIQPSNFFLTARQLEEETSRFAVRLIEASDSRSPFGRGDTSVGMEYELQVAVEGASEDVDLPRSIRESSFFRNTLKRAARGDLPKSSVKALTDFLDNNDSCVWENSWVQLDEGLLGQLARSVLKTDLLADKGLPSGPNRTDTDRFYSVIRGERRLRIPVSYLLKLAFADSIDSQDASVVPLQETGKALLNNFQSDNTSPEILSLTIPRAEGESIGDAAAQEAARTFLVIQLLCQYANSAFRLEETGQRVRIYNAPLAPHRQKKLNELVPDEYYRHLFMSPCLSGWERGEEKHRYMGLCHQTLSRSQLNAIGKLKDAGIITNNLVILPNTSNTCLANNGTHVSLGSAVLTRLAADPVNGLSPGVEKYAGDLIIKIVEHFLPLLVKSYTASPYCVDFADFHPEKVLGFLPHELDYTHLRMLWRRWKKKADVRFMGRPLTPFGPRGLDQLLARSLGLSGDFIPDFRLVDYFITLRSTESCPALDGREGNQEMLKAELSELGVFDSRMSMYLPYRQRLYGQMGYSGFEGRSYSLFPSFIDDMAAAVDVQNLITALAASLVFSQRVQHCHIPDLPVVESERRQIFFAAAIGVPTVYIRTSTPNTFLRSLLRHVSQQRSSRRYRNYTRIRVDQYCLALVKYIESEGARLVEQLDMGESLSMLRERLTEPEQSASARLVAGTKATSGWSRAPGRISADRFNDATERYYRTALKRRQLQEGLQILLEDCRKLSRLGDVMLQSVCSAQGIEGSVEGFINSVETSVLEERLTPMEAGNLLQLCLTAIHHERHKV